MRPARGAAGCTGGPARSGPGGLCASGSSGRSPGRDPACSAPPERRGLRRAADRRRRRHGDSGRAAAAGAVRGLGVTGQGSPRRRREVIDALRRGTVPVSGLDLLATGLERFTPAADADLETVAGGGSALKAVGGEYGAGKTFLPRYLAVRALRRGFAAA